MNKIKLVSVIRGPALILTVLLLVQCGPGKNSTYDRIRAHAGAVKVINTHEHQHHPGEFPATRFRFYQLLAAAYLEADLITAGAQAFDMKLIDTASLDYLWDQYGKALNYSRNTSYYSHFAMGFVKLYDFNDLFFTKENIARLSDEIEKNYTDYESWFDNAFRKAGFEKMFLDQYWKPFNTEVDTRYYALVFHINPLISSATQKPEKGAELRSIYRMASDEGFSINNLDDYLSYCDHLFKRNAAKGAVCIKNSQAYSRTLYYEDVPYKEANELFNRPSSGLSPVEAKRIEDFMFHWIIGKAVEYDLPVQIHTGYLAGNGNTLENSRPTLLNNLFLKYPKAKFDLFHGGFPWTGEFAALGKMFPNVYLNLVWLPQISREEAISTLEVIFDCVPYNKILWGGDCHPIEESAGSLEYGRDVVSEVLARRVERGLLTEEVAFEIIDRIFRENAIELFRLD